MNTYKAYAEKIIFAELIYKYVHRGSTAKTVLPLPLCNEVDPRNTGIKPLGNIKPRIF